MRERDIQAEILAAFAGRADVRLWRSNAGTARSRDGSRFVRFGVPGQGDLSGILMDGTRIEVEAKTATGRQSEQQRAFEAMIRKFGGLYILARSADDAVRGVNDAIRGIRSATGGREENGGGF